QRMLAKLAPWISGENITWALQACASRNSRRTGHQYVDGFQPSQRVWSSGFGLRVSTAVGRPAERFQQRPERVELRAEAAPVACLQALDGAVVVGKRLAGARVRRAGASRRNRSGGAGQWRSGVLEERGQRDAERFLHHHAGAVGG